MTRLLKCLSLIALVTMLMGTQAVAQRGPASVFVEPALERDFAQRIEALGTLEPNEVVDLTLNVADRVQSLYFDDGQRVRKGKTLLSLAQREQIALTEGAEANADEARRQLDRIQRLIERKAVSQSELDEAQRNLDAATAQLRAVQSRQKDRVLVAPFDGVLGFRQVSVGSYVRPGDVVARLIDDSEMNLEFTVPSTFLRALKPGTAVRATTDDLPGSVFEGVITSLDNAIDPVTRSVRVRATLPNPDRELIAGMFMEIVLTADPRARIAIPEEAVQPVGPRSFVFIVDNSDGAPKATRIEVKLGALQDGYIEVISGLEAGQRVITEGVIRVREGAEIKIESKDMLKPRVGGGMTGNRSSAGG
ncbi:efflux RND transporter periplasmic adaptor subunit [Fretibacter rubidus]|uniref:efflux RND transporter periplasmic adaptor subunit n=1 Tax=Fretibacter rubidus TaxID=570162 RepID=UPI00352B0C57